jgi:hypothetical protein
MLKITLCKTDAEEFKKSGMSKKFDITINNQECEWCKERIENVTDRYNTEDGQQHDIGDDECESGVCPVR